MSIRCSLLGHDYGDTETEREREEQGSEVVVTVREFEECARCGERKIVSENKEVTSIESPAPDLESAEAEAAMDAGSGAGEDAGSVPGGDADAGVDFGGGDTGPSATPGTGSGGQTGTGASGKTGASTGGKTGTGTGGMGVPDEAVPAAGDDAEILDDSTDDAGATGGNDPSEAGSPSGSPTASERSSASGDRTGGLDSGTDAAPSAAETDVEATGASDDAEILTDDASDETGDRTPGEWPDAETTHPAEADDSEPGNWPSVGQEDEGFDAEPDNGASTDVEFGGGLAPESGPEVDEDETDEVEFVNASGDTLGAGDAGRASDTGPRGDAGGSPELSSGISAGAEAPSISGPSDDPDLDAEFVCPECDYREEVSGSSLRAGDICPECGRGYLAQE